MSKRVTKVSKVARLIEANPAITSKEIATKTDIPIAQVYVIRHNLKKKAGSPPTTKTRRKKTFTYKATGLGGIKFDQKVENLEEEIVRLNDWCLQWRKKCEELRDENERLKEGGDYKQKFLDAMAVIAYLEGKLHGKT